MWQKKKKKEGRSDVKDRCDKKAKTEGEWGSIELGRKARDRAYKEYTQSCKLTGFRILVEESIIRAVESLDRMWSSGDIMGFMFQKGSINTTSKIV